MLFLKKLPFTLMVILLEMSGAFLLDTASANSGAKSKLATRQVYNSSSSKLSLAVLGAPVIDGHSNATRIPVSPSAKDSGSSRTIVVAHIRQDTIRQNYVAPYTTVVNDIIGIINLRDEESSPTDELFYLATKATVTDPKTGNVVGEAPAFDVDPASGEIYAKTFVYEYNQQTLKFNVTSEVASVGLHTVRAVEVTVWICDDTQLLELTFVGRDTVALFRLQKELVRDLESWLNYSVAVGGIVALKTDPTLAQRFAMRFGLIGGAGQELSDANLVLQRIDRGSPAWHGFEVKYGVISLQAKAKNELQDISLVSIILIAVCTVFLLSIVLVCCVCCCMRRRLKHQVRQSYDTLLRQKSVLHQSHPPPVHRLGSFPPSGHPHYYHPAPPGSIPVPYIYGSEAPSNMSTVPKANLAFEEQELSLSITSEPATTLPRSHLRHLGNKGYSDGHSHSSDPNPAVVVRRESSRRPELYF